MSSTGDQPPSREPEPTGGATAGGRGGSRGGAALGDGPELMPVRVLIIACAWSALLIAAFFLYIEVVAVADFFPSKLGPLPFEAIWFGAIGGLVISLKGIFKHNRNWRPSYNYWHYMRPMVGAIIGTLGCLIFIVLTEAATKGTAAKSSPVFYDVVALGVGYREASFRALLGRLIDAVILPPESRAPTKTATDQPANGRPTSADSAH